MISILSDKKYIYLCHPFHPIFHLQQHCERFQRCVWSLSLQWGGGHWMCRIL